MAEIFLLCVNVAYAACLLIASALLEIIFFTIYWPVFFLRRRGTMDEAMRVHNWLFGRLVVRTLWPLIRVRCAGWENVPRGRSCVLVVNHRSFADIIFCAQLPTPRMQIIVRNWPFGIWLLGWFMKWARYINIEATPLEQLAGEMGRALVRRGVPFLFFPEGHRSRDGKLQRFHSGAFTMAAAHDLPVVPVCMSGTERLVTGRWPLIRPTRVTMEILPAMTPASFPEEKRAMRLKRAVEGLYREHFGE